MLNPNDLVQFEIKNVKKTAIITGIAQEEEKEKKCYRIKFLNKQDRNDVYMMPADLLSSIVFTLFVDFNKNIIWFDKTCFKCHKILKVKLYENQRSCSI